MKKLIKFLITLSLCFAMIPNVIVNAEVCDDDKIVLSFDPFIIETSYSTNDYYVVYSETESAYLATIFDVSSGEDVDCFISEKEELLTRAGSTMRTFRNEKTEVVQGTKKLKWGTEVKAMYYSSGSFAQIDYVSSATNYIATYMTEAIHQDDNIAYYSESGSYPTYQVNVSSSTSIVYCVSNSNSGGASATFTVSKLLEFGFGYDYSTTTNTYYSKRCDNNYSIRVGVN